MLVEAIMTSGVMPLNTETPLSQVEKMAIDLGIYHVPIIDQGKYVGLLDVSCFTEEDREQDVSIDTYRADLVKLSVGRRAFVFDTLKLFVEEEYTAIPVVDETESVIGLLRLIDIIRYLENTISIKHRGAFITLKLGQNDYNLQEIARIVESNDARVLSVHFEPDSGDGHLLCTIKINQEDLSHILATFERFDYQPIAHSSINDDHDDLSDRYNLLMKFLNI